ARRNYLAEINYRLRWLTDGRFGFPARQTTPAQTDKPESTSAILQKFLNTVNNVVVGSDPLDNLTDGDLMDPVTRVRVARRQYIDNYKIQNITNADGIKNLVATTKITLSTPLPGEEVRTLVFVPGFGQLSSLPDPTVLAFAEQGNFHYIIAAALPEIPQTFENRSNFETDSEAILAAFRLNGYTDYLGDKVLFSGYSEGSQVAISLSAKLPNVKRKSIVLLSSFGLADINDGNPYKFAARFAGEVAKIGMARIIPNKILPEYDFPGLSPVNIAYKLILVTQDLIKVIRRIDVPALFGDLAKDIASRVTGSTINSPRTRQLTSIASINDYLGEHRGKDIYYIVPAFDSTAPLGTEIIPQLVAKLRSRGIIVPDNPAPSEYGEIIAKFLEVDQEHIVILGGSGDIHANHHIPVVNAHYVVRTVLFTLDDPSFILPLKTEEPYFNSSVGEKDESRKAEQNLDQKVEAIVDELINETLYKKTNKTDDEQAIANLADQIYYLLQKRVLVWSNDRKTQRNVVRRFLIKRNEDLKVLQPQFEEAYKRHDRLAIKNGVILSDPTIINPDLVKIILVDRKTMRILNPGRSVGGFYDMQFGLFVIRDDQELLRDLQSIIDHEVSHQLNDLYDNKLLAEVVRYFGEKGKMGWWDLINEGKTEYITYFVEQEAAKAENRAPNFDVYGFSKQLNWAYEKSFWTFRADIRKALVDKGFSYDDADKLLLSIGPDGLQPLIDALGGWDKFFEFFASYEAEAAYLDPSRRPVVQSQTYTEDVNRYLISASSKLDEILLRVNIEQSLRKILATIRIRLCGGSSGLLPFIKFAYAQEGSSVESCAVGPLNIAALRDAAERAGPIVSHSPNSLFLAQLAVTLDSDLGYQVQMVKEANRVLAIMFQKDESGWEDKSTRGHSHRVSQNAVTLAQFLSWLDVRFAYLIEEAPLIQAAALIHDIGKDSREVDSEGESVASLIKQSQIPNQRLSLAQVNKIRYGHTSKGVEMLRRISPTLVSDPRFVAAVSQHHQKWNGETVFGEPNYPSETLADEKIHIWARLIGLVDWFDVAIGLDPERPYAVPRPLSSVLIDIKERMGAQFDPSLETAFEQFLVDFYQQLLEHPPELSPNAPEDFRNRVTREAYLADARKLLTAERF
ncbi:MAG: HD domain-containing protein, partial [Patescibacteria group bacterium]